MKTVFGEPKDYQMSQIVPGATSHSWLPKPVLTGGAVEYLLCPESCGSILDIAFEVLRVHLSRERVNCSQVNTHRILGFIPI